MFPKWVSLRRPLSEWWLFVEASVSLLHARLLLLLLPFRTLAQRVQSDEDAEPQTDSADSLLLKRIHWSLYAGSRHLPLRIVCLPRAVAAKAMLDRRGIRSTLFLGVKREDGEQGLAAHAWVTVGQEVVCGAEGMKHFTEVARFS